MRSVLCLGAAIAGLVAGPAFASGGIGCQVDDKNVTLSIESGVSHGLGGPLFNFRSEATLKSAKVPADLKVTKFEQAHVPQYWLGDGELRLVLYRERENDKPHGYVEITVRTKGGEEGYDGTYELSVFDVPEGGDQTEFKAKGKLSCIVD